METKIIINFKTYEQATGSKAVELAKICDEAAKETGAAIIVAVQAADIYRVAQAVEIPVYAQHIDNAAYGSYTGRMLAETAKDAGATGSLINHSENRVKLADMEAAVMKLKGQNMTSIICTNNINTTRAAAALRPDYVAVEPPELIGSGISVSDAQPEIVTGSVKAAQEVNPGIKVLCGAGITKGDDIKKSSELGACGVLLASGVTKAKDPKTVLLDLARGV